MLDDLSEVNNALSMSYVKVKRAYVRRGEVLVYTRR
jgi:hypothetical protein